jgi:hypothetical protein
MTRHITRRTCVVLALAVLMVGMGTYQRVDAQPPSLISGNAAGTVKPVRLDAWGQIAVGRTDGIRCTVTVSTATTIQAVGGSCAAPGVGLSIYVTDILFATNAGAIAADSFNTLKYGTGGTCGTGTNVFWGAMNTAAAQTTTIQSFETPIKIPANNEICWINSTAGSKFLVISGFIAP